MHEMDLMEIDINMVAQLFDNYCQIIIPRQNCFEIT